MILHNPPVENPFGDARGLRISRCQLDAIGKANNAGFPTGSTGRGKPLSEKENC